MNKREELQSQIESLQKELDNYREGYEMGVWYKCPTKGKAMFRVVKSSQHSTLAYGLNYAGEWLEDNNWATPRPLEVVEATLAEVRTMLFKEAERRGFKEGVLHNTYDRSSSLYPCKGDLKMGWGRETYALHFQEGSGLIFLDGEWANIIDTNLPIINGYKLYIQGEFVEFGCARFHRNQLLKLYEWLKAFNLEKDSNRSIGSFTLNSGVSISLVELEVVVKYLNSI